MVLPNTIRLATSATKNVAKGAARLTVRTANKEIRKEVKKTIESGSDGFKQGLQSGYNNYDNKENFSQKSLNDLTNDVVNQHIDNAKAGKNFLDNNEVTQSLSEETKTVAGHAISASAMILQGMHRDVAKEIGRSQGVKAGALAASTVQQGQVEANKAKQSVTDFMKQASDKANTAYNSPMVSAARKTLDKTR